MHAFTGRHRQRLRRGEFADMTGGGWETIVMVAGLVLAGWSVLWTVRRRPTDWWLVGGAAVLEVMVLVQLVLSIAALASGSGPASAGQLPVFIGYLIGVALVIPAGVAWSAIDRTRWGPAVIAVAALVIPVLIIRLQQIWRTDV